jgi:two-component system, NarL family, invasion response regulator UvrY
MTRVLLVDDHAVVRQGLKQVLADSLPDATFGDAASADEALRMVHTANWDIVVLDISLPGKSGIEALKELRAAHPRLPVLVLSMHPEEQFAVRALKAGAAGYVTKRTAARDVVAAVRKVLSGGRYVSASLAERLAAQTQAGSVETPHETLSDREYQVFRLLAMGKTVKQIGKELDLSPQTVSTHRTHILEKMGLESNAELIQYAMHNQIRE